MKRELELEWFQQEASAQAIALRAMQAMSEAKIDSRLVMLTMFEYGFSKPCNDLSLDDQMFFYEFIEGFLDGGRKALGMADDEKFTAQEF